MERRKFIQLAGIGIPFLLPERPVTGGWNKNSAPIVVSTWNSGMAVNAAAWDLLVEAGSSIDAVEAGARYIEDQIDCCVGLDGYPDRDGIVTLDSCIMDGDANCGAVAGMERIRHPISVARKIMENTPHILLVGNGAQQFALENGFELQPETLSQPARNAYTEWLKKNTYKPVINIENMPIGNPLKKQNGPFAPPFFENGSPNHDTMGLLAIDNMKRIAGAVTTSGMAFKMHGRVGDSPVIGAGLFVDNEVGAATSSGVGEEVIRICGTHLVVEYMRRGYSPEKACKKAVERIIKRNRQKAESLQVGFLAIDKNGRYGSYSIQKGFVFSVKSKYENQVHTSKHLL